MLFSICRAASAFCGTFRDNCSALGELTARGILKSVASAVLFCAKQCIALRGDAEQLDSPGNPGNFLALLKLLAVNDQELHQHLQSAMRNITHMSPQTQNELIEVMGKHIVLRTIVDELKAARWYAILADEVTSHNIEHLAICAWFADLNNDIQEAFIGLDRITGAEIADAIIKFLWDNDVPFANMRGQGYNDASNMSFDRVRVQARIQQAAPLTSIVVDTSASLAPY